MSDEIEYNAFYHILQNKFRKKYEEALSNCWTICIPTSSALRGVDINEEFIDLHVLKPAGASSHLFIDQRNSYHFCLGSKNIILCEAPFPLDEKYVINITCVESGYNKEFQQYKILIIDKPLSPKLISQSQEYTSAICLDNKINSLQDTTNFLSNFSPTSLESDVVTLMKNNCFVSYDLDEIKDVIHEVIGKHWVQVLQSQSLELQRDARFQRLLTTALENYVLHRVYDILFPVICKKYCLEDEAVLEQVRRLAAEGVTADQLGAPEDYAVPLPAAVVELASLDSLSAPIDKLQCLRTTLDLIVAELKGAIIDVQSVVSAEADLPLLNTDDLVPLLMGVIVQSKPLHMVSNLFYVENFQWTLSPSDVLSFSVVTFRAAVQELVSIKICDLKPRSEKVHRELGLEELIKVTGEVGQHFDRKGERRFSTPLSPLDRELERVTSLIEASTKDLNPDSQDSAEDCDIPGPNNSRRPFLTNLQAMAACWSKQEEP